MLHLETEDHITVEWKNVELEENPTVGQFSFQVNISLSNLIKK